MRKKVKKWSMSTILWVLVIGGAYLVGEAWLNWVEEA